MDNEKRIFRAERHDRFWTGLALLIVGSVLLADKMGVDFPDWLFNWPSLLILIGLVSGFKSRFQNFSWLIMVIVGGIFLADRIDDSLNFREYVWPVAILAVGLLFIMRPRKRWRCEGRNRFETSYVKNDPLQPQPLPPSPGTGTYEGAISREDEIESISIFGGVKKVVTSKNFRGGEIICFMGGAEYNLTQADFTGTISIEVLQAFGGTKLIVPPHWEVRSESVAIFAGIEDKRPSQPGAFDPSKVLVIKGTTLFGGIEIKSY